MEISKCCIEISIQKPPKALNLNGNLQMFNRNLHPKACKISKSQQTQKGKKTITTRWSPRTRMQTRSKSYICPNDTLVGHSCGTLLWVTLVGNSCGTLLRDTLVGHSCGTLLWDTVAGHSCGTLLWDTHLGHSCGTLLWDTLVGHSCGTLLWDTLIGHSCRKPLWETLVGHCCDTLVGHS